MRKATSLGQHSVTVPDHREVAIGTPNDILNEVSPWNSIPKERLIRCFESFRRL
jgi:hypothetical protein